MAERGWEVTAIDNLGSGLAEVAEGFSCDYDDWVQLLIDYLAHEKGKDDGPIVL